MPRARREWTEEESWQAFLRKVKVTPAGCWEWQGATDRTGYGQLTFQKKHLQAHRHAYEHEVGPIPDGLDLDHMCHNNDKTCAGGWPCPHKRCVNPAHLEPATRSLNLRRGRSRRADDECRNGHPRTQQNTRWVIEGDMLRRRCADCANASGRANYTPHPRQPVDPYEGSCPKGHARTEQNTRVSQEAGRTRRRCTDCQREADRRRVRTPRQKVDA